VWEPSREVTVRAPAKINPYLGVGQLREDGYHELRTIYQGVSLFDEVTVSAAPQLSLTVLGAEGVEVPVDDRNLAWRAAELLAAHLGVQPNVSITIHKQIPMAAGLGGGSADAAATLLALRHLWDAMGRDSDFAHLASALGSDVPFAMRGGTAMGAGRGEQVNPMPECPLQHWVVAAADGGLSTPDVYRELDRQRDLGVSLPAIGDPAGVVKALLEGDVELLAENLGNDLEPASITLAPYLAHTLAAGRDLGALAGIVSGSGPTCVFLAADHAQAERLAEGLNESGTCRFAKAVVGGAMTHETTTIYT
jgi:4-diphosphocytidyl-2-C-methyl-D-erythritol kinase